MCYLVVWLGLVKLFREKMLLLWRQGFDEVLYSECG
jgi:hypothetical protein